MGNCYGYVEDPMISYTEPDALINIKTRGLQVSISAIEDIQGKAPLTA